MGSTPTWQPPGDPGVLPGPQQPPPAGTRLIYIHYMMYVLLCFTSITPPAYGQPAKAKRFQPTEGPCLVSCTNDTKTHGLSLLHPSPGGGRAESRCAPGHQGDTSGRDRPAGLSARLHAPRRRPSELSADPDHRESACTSSFSSSSFSSSSSSVNYPLHHPCSISTF